MDGITDNFNAGVDARDVEPSAVEGVRSRLLDAADIWPYID